MKQRFMDKHIFLTGATGFVGLCLLQKILYSLPVVAKVFILVRSKKQLSSQKRVFDQILSSPCFQRLRQRHKDSFHDFIKSRIEIITGDLSIDGMGICLQDMKKLQQSCEIIIHSGALTALDSALAHTFYTNTRGSIQLFQAAKKMKKLEQFVYISTLFAYQQIGGQIQQKIYDQEQDPLDQYNQIMKMSQQQINASNRKLIGKFETNYQFTKNLTERCMARKVGNISLAIVRLPIVTGCYKQPFPGYIGNVTGMNGFLFYAAKGIIHHLKGNQRTINDYLPMDYVVNSIIAISGFQNTSKQISVYHLTNAIQNPISFGMVRQSIKQYWSQNTSRKQISKPFIQLFDTKQAKEEAENKYRAPILQKFQKGIYQNQQEKKLIEIQVDSFKKSSRFQALFGFGRYFNFSNYSFSINKWMQLRSNMDKQFLRQFPINPTTINNHAYLIICNFGIHTFIMKQKGILPAELMQQILNQRANIHRSRKDQCCEIM